jgi:hypothetical protein
MGLSSYQIKRKVKQEFDGVGPNASTICCYVHANLQGMYPLKHGVQGDIPPCVFKLLCIAFESFVRIMQINSKEGEITFKKLSARINAVLRHDYKQKMLQSILLALANNLDALTMHIAEDRQVRWTTQENISCWFNNWEFNLLDLGFATKGADGKVTISNEQLYFIINFDETCLSFDGSEGNREGPPQMTLHDPRLPYNGKRANKDSLTATWVCGSNAAGEALPPHFQFQTKATTDKGERICNKVFGHVRRVKGKFGYNNEKSFDVTFGLNTKGGMDDCEFRQYVVNSVLPLYPKTRDKPGHCLLLKCDSGPGRLQIKLLAELQYLGVYLYPCVPNTTAVTQETDRTYGGFKSQYRANLELLVDELVKQDKSVSVPQYKHGLMVFRGVNPDTDLELPSAFELGFSRQHCLNLWAKIGAVPLTCKCLDDPQVRRSIDLDKNYALLVNSVQESNEYAVYSLTVARMGGPITERMSKEWIELLACANTHSKKFFATGGSHVCSDDFFKAQALLASEDELAEKEKLKKTLQQNAELRKKGMAILVEKATCFESNNYHYVSVKELDILMQWYGVEKNNMKKAEKVAKWQEIRLSGTAPPVVNGWTDEDEDEEQLTKIKNKEIDMSETYLGRYAAIQKRNAVAAILDFTDEEWESVKRMKEADALKTTEAAVADNIGNSARALETENGANMGDIIAEAV